MDHRNQNITSNSQIFSVETAFPQESLHKSRAQLLTGIPLDFELQMRVSAILICDWVQKHWPCDSWHFGIKIILLHLNLLWDCPAQVFHILLLVKWPELLVASWFGRAYSLFSILLHMYRREKFFYKHDLFYTVFYFSHFMSSFMGLRTQSYVTADTISHTTLSPKSDHY